MRRIIISLILVAAGFVGGTYAARARVPEIDKVSGVTGKNSPIADQVDFEPFWKAWNVLNEKYVPPDASATSTNDKLIFNQKLVWGAIEGLAAGVGDPYTAFFPPEDTKIFKSDISGNFEGVGMEIAIKDDVLTVIAPLNGSPAEKAGVKAGDKIIEIDAKTTRDLSVEEAVSQIRGPRGTSVKLTLVRAKMDEPLTISVTRDVIDIPALKTETKVGERGSVFVIHLYSFSASSPTLFRDALEKFANSGTDKLIIDLRGNPGGYLEAAVDMASWFLPEGKVVVREYFGEGKEEEVHRSKGYDVFSENLKIVILIDGGSASASEILAGALREQKKIPLVGEKTFGKGSVQELVDITRNTSLKVTVARWLTPNGLSISERGLEPDYKVSITKEDIEKSRDPQLEKAIEIVFR